MRILLMINQYYRNRKGQSMVEFALVLPLLLLLLGGIIDFGHAFYQYSSIENAARDAARRASINKSTEEKDEDIISSVKNSLPASWKANVTITRQSGLPVTATVTCKPQAFYGRIYTALMPDPLKASVSAAPEE